MNVPFSINKAPPGRFTFAITISENCPLFWVNGCLKSVAKQKCTENKNKSVISFWNLLFVFLRFPDFFFNPNKTLKTHQNRFFHRPGV